MKSMVVVLLITLSLAGCAEDQAPSGPEETEIPVVVSEGFGAIRGVVVDDRIVPVGGVTVTLQGESEGETVTAADGSFTFTDLTPGTYFLSANSPLHQPTQTSVLVEEGDRPPVTKLLLERKFAAEPYTVQVRRQGYFQCSQAGAGLYSSSNCVYDPYKWAFGPGDSPSQEVDNVTQQEREWHSDVGPGWQSLVFEMTWDQSTAGTSEQIGIVVSTYKPEREGTHWFAEQESGNPLLLRLDEGEMHASASGVEPAMIPASGLQNMSYFVSVKQDNWPVPAFAFEQEFTLILTQFYYLPAPEGWSFVNGDPLPA